MMPYDSSHLRHHRALRRGSSYHRYPPALMHEILREAARNKSLPSAIVDGALRKDLYLVSQGNASQIAREFSMELSLLRDAVGVVEERLAHAEATEDLQALHATLLDEALALPLRVSEVRDPVAILRALHKAPEVRVAPEFVSAILGIRDERVGGDVERFSREQLATEYSQGGFMYQPSEIVDMWPLFEHLEFSPGSVFCDLGSGYGHAVFYGAALRPDLIFKGIEIMSARVEECQSVADRLGMRNVTFAAGDLSKGGFGDADIIFLFNPFPPDTEGEVQRHIAKLAEERPLVIIDYHGLVTYAIPTGRYLPLEKVAPYSIMVSRRFPKESRRLIGI